MKIGLFYGSSTCYTEMAAEKIRDLLGADIVSLHNIKNTPFTEMENYSLLILGISTWDFGELQEDWQAAWSQWEKVKLKGKTVALFGLGDQEGYSEWFLDALGILHEKLKTMELNLIGYWPIAGYQFEASKALTEDKQYFVGLALDEDNQFDQSEARISIWCEQILAQYLALQ